MTRYLPSAQSRSSSDVAESATCASVMVHGMPSRVVLDFGKPA